MSLDVGVMAAVASAMGTLAGQRREKGPTTGSDRTYNVDSAALAETQKITIHELFWEFLKRIHITGKQRSVVLSFLQACQYNSMLDTHCQQPYTLSLELGTLNRRELENRTLLTPSPEP